MTRTVVLAPIGESESIDVTTSNVDTLGGTTALVRSIVRQRAPQPDAAWSHELFRGLRFRFSPSRLQILAGHTNAYPRDEAEVIDIFSDFVMRYSPGPVEYTTYPTAFPRVYGWGVESRGVEIGSSIPIEHERSRVFVWILSFAAIATVSATEQTVVTVLRSDPRVLLTELRALFESARDEAFEYGEESSFANRLAIIISEAPTEALSDLSALLFEEWHRSKEAALEALAVVGRSESVPAAERLPFLMRFLTHPAPSMRDAAGLALLDLGDERAGDSVRLAAEREAHPQVRKNLRRTAEQLVRVA